MSGVSSSKPLPSFFKSKVGIAYLLVCTILVAWVLWYAAKPTIERQLMSIVFLHICIIMLAIRSWIFEEYGIFKMRGKINKILCTIFTILSIFIMVYFISQYYELTYWRAGAPNIIDIILGGIAMILVLETARKDTGYWIPIIVIIFLIYGYIGSYMPGMLRHIGFGLFRLIEICSVELGIGIYGSLTGIAATWIAAFVMFAGLASGFGALDGIIKLAKYVAAKWKYGIPQTGVIASMFFGMCSGSAPANVAGTGSFTIPLNKSYGIPAKFAGAIEAVASSGGLIMPPIMGAAAFIIAAYLGTTYWHIVLVAFPAAFLYYTTTAFSVYLISLRYMKNIVVKLEVEPLSLIIKELSPLIIGLIVLIYFLAQLYDPLIAGFYAILTLLITSFILFLIKFYKSGGLKKVLKEYGKGFIGGIVNGAEIAATTGIMLAAIMMIVSVLTVSGLGVKLSMGMVYISGGNLILLSLLVAIVCIVFGMGVSATAAYILTVVIAAPAFIAIGVNPLSAHFYVFYFSILSAITPPVAIAAVVASRISGAPYFQVCIESIKIGITLFILPIIFIMYPDILALNINTLRIFIFLLITFWGLSVGMYGFEVYPGRFGLIMRVGILALSLFTLIAPIYIGWLITYILLFILLLLTVSKVVGAQLITRIIGTSLKLDKSKD
ncbi:MAG: TRAP transporter fused permease subunit [Nitrososphaerales archaeon]